MDVNMIYACVCNRNNGENNCNPKANARIFLISTIIYCKKDPVVISILLVLFIGQISKKIQSIFFFVPE